MCITGDGWTEGIIIPSITLSSSPPAAPHLNPLLSSPVSSSPSDVSASRTSGCTSHMILRFTKLITAHNLLIFIAEPLAKENISLEYSSRKQLPLRGTSATGMEHTLNYLARSIDPIKCESSKSDDSFELFPCLAHWPTNLSLLRTTLLRRSQKFTTIWWNHGTCHAKRMIVW